MGPEPQPPRRMRTPAAIDSRAALGCACGAGGTGAGGKKPSPKEASRSETNSPNTPAGSAAGAGLGVFRHRRLGLGRNRTDRQFEFFRRQPGLRIRQQIPGRARTLIFPGRRSRISSAAGTSSASSTETSSTASGCLAPACASAASISCHTAASWAAPGFSFSSLVKTTRAWSAMECAR